MEKENTKAMKSAKESAKEVVTEEIRKGNLVKSKEVLDMLPDLIDTVDIDIRKIRQSLSISNHNPLNAFFKQFGFQLIKEKNLNHMLNFGSKGNDFSSKGNGVYNHSDENAKSAKRWLTLNKNGCEKIVKEIAQKLFELETQANKAYDEEKQRGDKLFEEHEKCSKEYNELKYSAETNVKLIAERIQYILSCNGKDAISDNGQLIELLKDLNIEVYWDSSEASFADSAMFTEFFVDDEVPTGKKPCLVRNGSVFVKGIRYVKK